jgi:predicted Rossmann fold nucleotide-binding protein DprA/Smf involved in DNA uptake
MSGVKPDPNQGELFDITKNFHGGADTSKAAHKSVTPNVRAQQRQRVLSAIKPGGSTCDEVEVALGTSHQATSARITELTAKGQIFDTGKRRKTRSGRGARVYKVT